MEAIIEYLINYARRAQNQEKLIEYLRDIDFKFINTATLREFQVDADWEFWPRTKHESYSWMVREIKHRHGKRCEYDFTLVFAIKLDGKKVNKFHIYYRNEYIKTFRIPWKDIHDINFRKMYVTLKFPDALNYVERRKWRTENLKHIRFPGKYPKSEFYTTWDPEVIRLEPKK